MKLIKKIIITFCDKIIISMNPETFKIELLTNFLTGSKLTFEHTYKRQKPSVRKELPQKIKVINVFSNFSCFLSSKNVDSTLKMVLSEGKVLTFKNNNNPKGLTNFDNIVKKLENFIDKHRCYDFYVEIKHEDKKFVYENNIKRPIKYPEVRKERLQFLNDFNIDIEFPTNKEYPKISEERLRFLNNVNIDTELPTKREEQETDKENDSLEYPEITKEQLDKELDEYISMRDKISESTVLDEIVNIEQY